MKSPIPLTIYQKSMRVDEGMLGPPLEKCPFCLSANALDTGITVHRDPDVGLFKCGSCMAAYAGRMPTHEALQKYYSAYYAKSDEITHGKAVTHSDTHRYANHIANIFMKYARNGCGANILDFGGGDGSLGMEVKKILNKPGTEASALGSMSYLVDISDTKPVAGCQKLPSLDDCGELRFDLIIASAIIEHLTDPRDYLQKLASKGRYIYFRTPYALPLMELAGKIGMALDFTFPGHVSDLGIGFYMNIGKCLPGFKTKTLHCGTTPTETSFAQDAPRALAAHLFKLPFRALTTIGMPAHRASRIWPFIGGAESLVEIGG